MKDVFEGLAERSHHLCGMFTIQLKISLQSKPTVFRERNVRMKQRNVIELRLLQYTLEETS